jgi:hypothetical protein
MMPTRCPKCGQADMNADHDRTHNVEAYACPVCGMRVYPGFPRRIRGGMRPILVLPYRPGNPCGICGAWVGLGSRGKPRGYCDACRNEARRRSLARRCR